MQPLNNMTVNQILCCIIQRTREGLEEVYRRKQANKEIFLSNEHPNADDFPTACQQMEGYNINGKRLKFLKLVKAIYNIAARGNQKYNFSNIILIQDNLAKAGTVFYY